MENISLNTHYWIPTEGNSYNSEELRPVTVVTTLHIITKKANHYYKVDQRKSKFYFFNLLPIAADATTAKTVAPT